MNKEQQKKERKKCRVAITYLLDHQQEISQTPIECGRVACYNGLQNEVEQYTGNNISIPDELNVLDPRFEQKGNRTMLSTPLNAQVSLITVTNVILFMFCFEVTFVVVTIQSVSFGK